MKYSFKNSVVNVSKSADIYRYCSFLLPNFSPMFHFHAPEKRYETFGFVTFLGGALMEHWAKMG